MSSPEKPEDKTAVITRPSAESTPEQPTVQASSGGSAAPPATPPATPAGGTPAAEPAAAEQEAPAAPPPWQRVTSDARYGEAQQVGPGDVAPEQATVEVGSQPAYPASDPDTVAVARPAVGGAGAPGGLLGSARTSVNLGAANGRPAQSGPSTRRPGRGPRRASLQVKRVDPWSVLKLALVLSVALFFVWLVAVGVLYGVLNGMGVWDKINNTANDLLQGNEATGDPLISAGRVFGVAAIVGAVNIVLFTALATVGAFVYNVSADLAGGLEVTLSERE
ncbi:DUF3566 domain-containing protein [Actinosynnema sp. NPDC047251]|uniref:DUF3566 domain-containing protein n=1 Tax=Saccharothrix espanaensis (strain ATCC 51144 / DSM 44229 / JCM 9112 / NBRC 15066 / NRRL 15764) TaxID=1179773 RepID=K3W412_SACES|nr:DUF3566 domain-containing protein [Saccharothrix espanaensis]CCH27342.1 hypothetical protein BN6_00090 [Saccharothrix espanaensis DSM 44229]